MISGLRYLLLTLFFSESVVGFIGNGFRERQICRNRIFEHSLSRAKFLLYGKDPDGSPPPSQEPIRVQQGEDNEREREQMARGEQVAKKNSFDMRLKDLKFGFESNELTAYGRTVALGSPRKPAVICSSTLEYDKRGCGETMSTTLTKRTRSSTIKTLRSLPCFSGAEDGRNSCPYVRLRCSRGHEWKAVPGSEVSTKCPICSASKVASMSASMSKRKGSPRKPKVSIFDRVTAHAESRGGMCSLQSEGNVTLHWNSSVPFECSNGHKWTATVTNILKKESWCARCLAEERLFLMQETAACFNGQFLGFVDDIDRRKKMLRYQFLDGTFGMMYEDFDAATGMFLQLGGRANPIPTWPRSKKSKERNVNAGSSSVGDATLAFNYTEDDKNKKMKMEVDAKVTRRPLSFSQSPAYWKCSRGHIFVQSSNNIRRKQGSARKCSWCPACSKEGRKFAWFPTSREKDLAIKKKGARKSETD